MSHAFPRPPSRLLHQAAWLSAALWGLLVAPPGAALPEDRNQAIYIQSDRAERDERKGTTVYTGDVEIDQGSLHISADHVTIVSSDDQVSEIIARGKPAKMHQKPAVDREPVYARARTIQYDVEREILTLVENATVTQEGSTVTGEQIVYYVQEQRVKATAGTSSTGQRRVETIIPPRRAASQTRPDAAPPAGAPAPESSADGAP